MAATFLTLKLSANTNPIQNFSLLSIPKCQNSSNFLCYSVNRLVRPRSLSLWCSIKATSFHIPSQITSLFSDATGKRTPDTSTSAERRIGGHAIMVLCLAVSLGLTRVGICRPAFAETPRIGHIELTLKQCPALRSLCMDYLYFGYIPLQNFYAAKDVCLDPNGLGSLEEEFRSMLKEIGKEETTGTFKLQVRTSLVFMRFIVFELGN
ncbi:hypothetical protein AMTR_s00096p00155360 [Amborella trichopoda]|uniref:Uncharacterized protein n=1 Tax=Amborella trichopoda TaxID=13333 RepID=W1NXT7_AMBTC|nr:hypothetical protein AMTR_s00096p00155360 [Amborella trichopoda]